MDEIKGKDTNSSQIYTFKIYTLQCEFKVHLEDYNNSQKYFLLVTHVSIS